MGFTLFLLHFIKKIHTIMIIINKDDLPQYFSVPNLGNTRDAAQYIMTLVDTSTNESHRIDLGNDLTITSSYFTFGYNHFFDEISLGTYHYTLEVINSEEITISVNKGYMQVTNDSEIMDKYITNTTFKEYEG